MINKPVKLRGSPSGIKSQLVFKGSKGGHSSHTHRRKAISLNISPEKKKATQRTLEPVLI